MKLTANIFRLMLPAAMLALATMLSVSCDKKREGIEPMLDVTPANIAGDWQVASWSSGKTLDEGCYVYLRMIRKDRLFEIYQNIDTQSARPRKITGEYNIQTDEEYGAVLRGKYDHGLGDWEHRYIVSLLTGGVMELTALDDPTDITLYERIDAIPDDILALFPDEE